MAVLSARDKCAELLCNFGISFEKGLLKQVWPPFSTNLPNLWFSAHSLLALLKPAAAVRVLLLKFNSQSNWTQNAIVFYEGVAFFCARDVRLATFLYLCAKL